jgi:hypothetical protein
VSADAPPCALARAPATCHEPPAAIRSPGSRGRPCERWTIASRRSRRGAPEQGSGARSDDTVLDGRVDG